MGINNKAYPGNSDFDPALRQITDYRQLQPITNAQCLALFTTPVTLVPAFGVGTILVFDEIKVQYIPVTTGFTINGGKLSVNYTNSGGLQVGQLTTTGFCDGTTNQCNYTLNLNVANGHLPTPNAPLVLLETVANLSVGDGSFLCDVRYRIEPSIVR
jgi:hypothetical protein